jgi:hypothetical protein
MRIILLIFSVLFTVYCVSQSDFGKNHEKLKKEYSIFKYKVDNKNDTSFGYFTSKEDGLIIGPSSVYLFGEIVLITDPFHNNIKCINLNSGLKSIISLPKSQVKKNSKLIDLYILDSLIYLIKTGEDIEIIDLKGNFKNKLVVPSISNRRYFGNKIICKSTYSSFSIHLESDYIQNPDYSFKLKLWNIEKSGQLKEKFLNINEYNYYDLKFRNIRGKQESVDFEFDKMTLKTQWGRFTLINTPLKVNYWENNNFDFGSNRVVIMEAQKNEIIIYSYLY